ncbi:hypothetical protein PLIIFM63780_001556 [Purpureocillium lilacinum]|nr:hypothetical protein PLIIFM63780_001556 [Purpureocillium lilacinum]
MYGLEAEPLDPKAIDYEAFIQRPGKEEGGEQKALDGLYVANGPVSHEVKGEDDGFEVEPRMMKSVASEQAAVEKETDRILARMASGASLERDGEARVAAQR